MTTTFLNSTEDIQWLLETHLRGVEIQSINSFILVRNEDSPEFIELYELKNPNFGDKPAFTIDFRKEQDGSNN